MNNNVDLKKIGTENRNQNTMNIDRVPTNEILRLINNEDKTVPFAVEKEIERLDETQQNTVVLFVRFLLSQKAAAPVEGGGARPRRYDFSRVAGRLKLREDPVAFQRRIRDEW